MGTQPNRSPSSTSGCGTHRFRPLLLTVIASLSFGCSAGSSSRGGAADLTGGSAGTLQDGSPPASGGRSSGGGGTGSSGAGAGGSGHGGADGSVAVNTDDYQISVGNVHTCVLDHGKLSCFGDNTAGQIGDGTQGSLNESKLQTTPYRVKSDTTWKRVAAGGAFTCALDASGARYCWGNDGYGQFGDGSRTSSPNPVGPIDDGWAEISSGGQHACGITTDGHLKCWGDNATSALGVDGDDSYVPLEPMPADRFSAVSAGPFYTCAIKNPGALWCWGSVPAQSDHTPKQLGTDRTWVAVDAGQYSACGLKSDHSLWCWGYGFAGLGQGEGVFKDSTEPLQVGTDTDWATVHAGAATYCAVKQDGSAYCWGWSGDGQVGQVTADDTLFIAMPRRVESPGQWSLVDVGGYVDGGSSFSGAQAAGFDASGALYTWGSGIRGQLGNGDSGRGAPDPRPLGTETFTAVGGGFALKADGTAWTWGPGASGYIGRDSGGGPTGSVRHPTPLQLQTDVAAIAASVALGAGPVYQFGRLWVAKDGTLWNRQPVCPTLDPNYQGFTLCPESTTQVGTDTDWALVAASVFRACAIKKSGALYCWGLGPIGNGQDGQGSNVQKYATPQPIAAGKTWKAVALGELQLCGIQTDGSLWCWGGDSWGELGQGSSFLERLVPARVGSASDWVNISAGPNATCGIRQGGALYCWGYHASTGQGQSAPDASLPAPTLSGRTFTDVDVHAAGCAVGTDGTLWCWGIGSLGEVGTVLPPGQNVQWDPIQVGTGSDWMAVHEQLNGTCALKKSGALWCWGDRQDALSGPPTYYRDVPAAITLP